MSELKSKVLGYRLSSDMLDKAEKMATACGDKNAGALGKRLLIERLSKNKDTASETLFDEPVKNQTTQLAAIENTRNLMLACFGMLFEQTGDTKAFRSLILPFEDEWRKITGITEQEPPIKISEPQITEYKQSETKENTVTDPFSNQTFYAEPDNSNPHPPDLTREHREFDQLSKMVNPAEINSAYS